MRGFSSAPWLWAVRAVTESPAVGAAVPAGCWFRCALSPAAVYPHLHCFIPLHIQKKAGKVVDTQESVNHLSGFQTRGVEEMY